MEILNLMVFEKGAGVNRLSRKNNLIGPGDIQAQPLNLKESLRIRDGLGPSSNSFKRESLVTPPRLHPLIRRNLWLCSN